ncbi:magnesium protoporphyrin IX methyltransferase [Algihabitans sp.]|uniref:magnesium protoporphyrin IX methyltransferase n=1 Tax=Algihabitans sp. TaxID=2821514 RepID=UPI003BAA0557
MPTATFATRRGQLEHYFDRTAVEAWARLTSDAPVSRIRATVRAGRERMRATLLSWLPQDLTGLRLLDAGCGTGLLSVEAARRGAQVVAVDVSPTLVGLAGDRLPDDVDPARLDFRVGDMLDPALGSFDHVVAMDSLIHYKPGDTVQALARLGERTGGSLLFTFAPRTPLLSAMHAAGQLFPRGDRAPAIEPVGPSSLRAHIARAPDLRDWHAGRSERIVSGFYTSQAQELVKGESIKGEPVVR